MTSSNALKCVVSDYETTTDEVAPRKPFNINPSVLRDTKSLLYGSLNGTGAESQVYFKGKRVSNVSELSIQLTADKPTLIVMWFYPVTK